MPSIDPWNLKVTLVKVAGVSNANGICDPVPQLNGSEVVPVSPTVPVSVRFLAKVTCRDLSRLGFVKCFLHKALAWLNSLDLAAIYAPVKHLAAPA